MKVKELVRHEAAINHKGTKWNVRPAAPVAGQTAARVQLEQYVDRHQERLASVEAKLAKSAAHLQSMAAELASAQAALVDAKRQAVTSTRCGCFATTSVRPSRSRRPVTERPP
jgi:septal ring factor EnvC (AmiA/AmiB activator)